jgi:hypothetical protein
MVFPCQNNRDRARKVSNNPELKREISLDLIEDQLGKIKKIMIIERRIKAITHSNPAN